MIDVLGPFLLSPPFTLDLPSSLSLSGGILWSVKRGQGCRRRTMQTARPLPVLRYKAPGGARLAAFKYALAAEIVAGQQIVSGVVTAVTASNDISPATLTIGPVSVAPQGTPLPDGSLAGLGDTVVFMLSGGVVGVTYGLECLATTNAATTPPTVLDQPGRLLVDDPPI